MNLRTEITNAARDIRDLALEELKDYLKEKGEPDFRAQQIFDWIYRKGVEDFSRMSNLSVGLRQKLREDFCFTPLTVMEKQVSSDGTTKFLFELKDGEKVETVMIPAIGLPATGLSAKDRVTVCVSTQAGCKFGCRFCASGIGGWTRNLTSGEILSQILHVKKDCLPPGVETASLRDEKGKEDQGGRNAGLHQPLSHVVFMGTGEPLDNYDELMKTIRVLNSPDGMNIGARRITVSTCGVIPKMRGLAKEGLQVELAVSLHGFDNTSRDVLMPVNRKYPFDDLMQACRDYIKATKRQITFEYILIKDVTCSDEAVKSLKKAFKGMICKMNLIPYNPVSEFDHEPPSKAEASAFKNKLNRHGIHATIRKSRGQDVNAACGQLRHAAQKEK